MFSFTFHNPTKVIFGKDTVELIAAEIRVMRGLRISDALKYYFNLRASQLGYSPGQIME